MDRVPEVINVGTGVVAEAEVGTGGDVVTPAVTDTEEFAVDAEISFVAGRLVKVDGTTGEAFCGRFG